MLEELKTLLTECMHGEHLVYRMNTEWSCKHCQPNYWKQGTGIVYLPACQILIFKYDYVLKV